MLYRLYDGKLEYYPWWFHMYAIISRNVFNSHRPARSQKPRIRISLFDFIIPDHARESRAHLSDLKSDLRSRFEVSIC